MLQTAIQYFMTNFGLGIVMIAIIFAGLLLMASRITLLTAAGIVAGAAVIGNYQAIANALFSSGGGA